MAVILCSYKQFYSLVSNTVITKIKWIIKMIKYKEHSLYVTVNCGGARRDILLDIKISFVSICSQVANLLSMISDGILLKYCGEHNQKLLFFSASNYLSKFKFKIIRRSWQYGKDTDQKMNTKKYLISLNLSYNKWYHFRSTGFSFCCI